MLYSVFNVQIYMKRPFRGWFNLMFTDDCLT
nr:MAG TPA: hypothetical protein [Caudoviricetes sp.]